MSFTSINGQNRRIPLIRKASAPDGVEFVRCRICGDHRRVISGRHLSKHGTDRETYMQEYRLNPDELIAKDFRRIQSSRRGFQLYGKNEWIDAIKKNHRRGGSVFAGDLQDTHAYLYNQGVWIFGDWDKTLRAIDANLYFVRHTWRKGKRRITHQAPPERTNETVGNT